MAEAHTLAVTGYADQSELLEFASVLEVQPEVGAIGLVREEGATGVFSVLTSGREALIDACARAPGFQVTVEVSAPGWDVLEIVIARRVRPSHPGSAGGRSRTRPALPPDGETLPRTHFPVIGRRSAEDAPAAPPEMARREMLADAIEVVLSDAPSSADTKPPWPPVQVEVYPPMLAAQVAEREQVRLVASPLRSFGQVNALRDRLAALEGVIGLAVGRFYRGALQLTVEYADVVPLASRLRELPEFAPYALRQPDAGTIEITFR